MGGTPGQDTRCHTYTRHLQARRCSEHSRSTGDPEGSTTRLLQSEATTYPSTKPWLWQHRRQTTKTFSTMLSPARQSRSDSPRAPGVLPAAPLLPGMIETVSFSQDTTLTYSCTEEGMRHLKTATFPRIDLWSSTRTVYGSLKTAEKSRWLVAWWCWKRARFLSL